MLVEDHQRNSVVACLLCKTLIKVGDAPSVPLTPPRSSGPPGPASPKSSRPPRR